MSDKHQQSDLWDACMKKCPPMFCGRLDMATWNAETGEQQKMVYFGGEDGRVICEGRRADFVAYAANRYQPMQDEIEQLRCQLANMLADAAVYNLHPERCDVCGREFLSIPRDDHPEGILWCRECAEKAK